MARNNEKFENLLCEKGDQIDNASYFLAVAIKRNNGSCEEEALAVLNALACDNEVPAGHEMAGKLIDKATKILASQGLHKKEDPAIGKDVEDDDVLAWNMHYIGELNDAAEGVLDDAGFTVCYPGYVGDDELPCYREGSCEAKNCPMLQK